MEKTYEEEIDDYMRTRPFRERFLWRFRERVHEYIHEELHGICALWDTDARAEDGTAWYRFLVVLAILLRRRGAGKNDYYEYRNIVGYNREGDRSSWSCSILVYYPGLRYEVISDGDSEY